MSSKEPSVTVNGIILTQAQSMTVRVALQTFGMELAEAGLGYDETGKAIAAGYLRCIHEINRIISKDAP